METCNHVCQARHKEVGQTSDRFITVFVHLGLVPPSADRYEKRFSE